MVTRKQVERFIQAAELELGPELDDWSDECRQILRDAVADLPEEPTEETVGSAAPQTRFPDGLEVVTYTIFPNGQFLGGGGGAGKGKLVIEVASAEDIRNGEFSKVTPINSDGDEHG